MNARPDKDVLAQGAGQATEAAHGNSAAGKHTDQITILQCRAGLRLTKRWRATGRFIDLDAYEDAKHFRIVPQKGVSSIHDLAKVLDKLARHNDHCVIRGTFAPDRAIKTKYEGSYQRLNANFDDAPHHWVMLDVDGLEPKGYHSHTCDPQPFIQDFIEKKLPDCFHYASYYWRLSSSAGAPGREFMVKAHLWFWLATPYTSAQLSAWRMLKALPVDGAVFRTVQIHYTADPVFEGCDDPIPAAWRSGFVDGPFGDEVPLEIPDDILRLVKTREPGEGVGAPDPTEKPGVIGAFCRAFTMEDVLERWLTEVFDWETAGETRRLDFLEGRGAKGGAFVSDCRQYIGNMHESDPFKGRLANKFDLVRQYVYGHLDDPDDPFDADQTKSASYRATVEALRALPEVQEQLALMAKEEEADQVTEAEMAKQLLEEFIKQPLDELKKHWPEQAASLLTAEAQHAFRQEVVSRLGISVTQYNAIFKEARQKQAKAEGVARAEKRANGRRRLLYEPDNEAAQAEQVEKLICAYVKENDREQDYFIFGGRPSRVVTDMLPEAYAKGSQSGKPPRVPRIAQYQDATLQVLGEKVAVFERLDMNGKPHSMRFPQGIKEIMLNRDDHHAASVSGLVTHPIVMPSGEILDREGLHSASGLLLVGASVGGCRPYTLAEAREAWERLKDNCLEGFEFESDLDKIAAIAFLFTLIERRVLDQAPAFAIVATNQSSGKTTLVRRMHVIATQHDLPVFSFPDREEELQKTLLSTMIASPALVCFDNIRDGRTLRSPALAGVLTSSSYKQRILGASREVTVPTNITFVITGNNLQLGRDEDSRWLTVRLDTRRADPEKRKFKYPDVVAHGRTIRDEVLRDVIGIVSGGLLHAPELPTGFRYPLWDLMVRRPLAWVTGVDVATVFDRNRVNSVERNEAVGTFAAIHAVMGDQWFAPKQLDEAASAFGPEDLSEERSVLAEHLAPLMLTAAGRPSEGVAARAKMLARRLLEMPRAEMFDGDEYLLEVRSNTDRKAKDFRVVRTDPFS